MEITHRLGEQRPIVPAVTPSVYQAVYAERWTVVVDMADRRPLVSVHRYGDVPIEEYAGCSVYGMASFVELLEPAFAAFVREFLAESASREHVRLAGVGA